MGVLGAIGVTYDDYISVDDVVTSEHYSMAEIAAGSVVIDNAHTSDGNDKCAYKRILQIQTLETAWALDFLWRYVAPQCDTDSNTAVQVLEKYQVLTNEQRKQA